MSIKASIAEGLGALTGTIALPSAVVGLYYYSTSLYEVENKVIKDSIKMKVEDVTPETTPKSIKVTVDDTNWVEAEANKYYWECQIKLPMSLTVNKDKVKDKLPKDDSTKNDSDAIKRKEILVKKCSKRRNEGANSKKVKTILDLSFLSYTIDESEFIKDLFDEK